MCDSEKADVDHGLTKAGLDDAVAHADDEEEKKGERISAGVEDGYYYHEYFCKSI